ncbi:MAG TPA: protein kinase [Candidatus Eisenbacteria bacterium]|nr:protein kinase [Candidatus Eisenbacteria bacterium]
MALATGTRLGTYEIVGPLGSGGMGEVYRAKDLRLGREVAVKVLPTGVASSPDLLARFEHEARTVAALNHPNIVTLYSVEDVDGIRFLTMELVEGQMLSTLVAPGGLPLARLLDLVIPLTEALATAHGRGVVHRDLKPGNVMVTREGRVKVLDFGLAKLVAADTAVPVGATTAASLSGEGQILGTTAYMAPEQLKGEAVDARSDLFAMGIIIYELATGRSPFPGGSVAEVSSAILRDTPQPLNQIRPDLPPDLQRIVGRCLEKQAQDRIQSALDLGQELRRLQTGESLEPPASDRVASIAVLPFANRSSIADDEYFSDGLADELLNVLSKIDGLRVIARTSSFQFKDSGDDAATIGRKLNVAALLEGSVRKSANRVRITVQLVRTSDSSQLWSETYDRTLEDIFAVQDDIAQSVVKALRTKLLGEKPDTEVEEQAEKAEIANATRGRGHRPEAQQLYLLAVHVLDRYTREGTAKAIEHLNQALALDPEFAAAWRQLGRAYASQAAQGWGSAAEGYERARKAMERALSLEPDLAEAHVALGWIRMAHDWDFRGAEASYARALGSEPRNATVLRGAGVLALTLGRNEEAIRLYRRAIEQDPLSSATYNNLGIALRAAGRHQEAEAAYRKALQLASERVGTHSSLALTLLAEGRAEEAMAEAMLEPDEAWRLWALAIIHDAKGQIADSDAVLRELTAKYATDTAHQIAEVHAARGDVDAAFEWLERAYAQRDGGLMDVKTSPYLHSLHGDPRWDAFLEKMGLDAG